MTFLGNNNAPSCSEVCSIFDFNACHGRYRPDEIGFGPLNKSHEKSMGNRNNNPYSPTQF